jgi:hypothetical protein
MIITAVFTVIVIIAIILQRIDWYKVFDRKYGYNPLRGRLYLENGDNINILDAKRIHSGTEGDIYEYRWENERLTVCLPPDYPHKNVKGWRLIRAVAGEAAARYPSNTQLVYAGVRRRRTGEAAARYPSNTQLAPEGVFSVSALVFSHLVTDLVKSMTGTKTGLNWKWFVVMAVVGVVAYFLFTQFLAPSPVVPPVTPVAPTDNLDGKPITSLMWALGVC